MKPIKWSPQAKRRKSTPRREILPTYPSNLCRVFLCGQDMVSDPQRGNEAFAMRRCNSGIRAQSRIDADRLDLGAESNRSNLVREGGFRRRRDDPMHIPKEQGKWTFGPGVECRAPFGQIDRKACLTGGAVPTVAKDHVFLGPAKCRWQIEGRAGCALSHQNPHPPVGLCADRQRAWPRRSRRIADQIMPYGPRLVGVMQKQGASRKKRCGRRAMAFGEGRKDNTVPVTQADPA